METPLDVLSRAATMVASVESGNGPGPGDVGFKRNLDQRNSPPKELPSKMYKFKRMKERQYMSQTLNYDDSHSEKINNKKCAGTQTSFSSFTSDPCGNHGPESPSTSQTATTSTDSYRILDLDKGKSVPNNVTSCSSRSQSHMAQGPPPPHPYMVGHSHNDQSHTLPLNLASPLLPPSDRLPPQHSSQFRPSVITCVPSTSYSRGYSGPVMSSGTFMAMHSRPSPTRIDANNAVCDPAIEEHFRRSLGKNYPGYLGSPGSITTLSPSPSPTRPTPQVFPPKDSSPLSVSSCSPDRQSPTVSVTGSVDDHFAKALGDKWVQIKSKNDPLHLDIFTGSVDDHFAKALGDTWYQIKAKQEHETSTGTLSGCQSGPSHLPV